MGRKRVTALCCLLPLCLTVLLCAEEVQKRPAKPTIRELETHLQEILTHKEQSPKKILAQAPALALLAELHAEAYSPQKALDVYAHLLRIAPSDVMVQIRMAELSEKTGDVERAVQMGKAVWEFAEYSELRERARKILAKHDAVPEVPPMQVTVNTNKEICILGVGAIDAEILHELRRVLQPLVRVTITVAPTNAPLPEGFDRTAAQHALDTFAEQFAEHATDEDAEKLGVDRQAVCGLSYEDKLECLVRAVRAGRGEETVKELRASFAEMEKQGQYRSPRVRQSIRDSGLMDPSSCDKDYLAVTEADLFVKEWNYCVGGGERGFPSSLSLVSIHRLRSSFQGSAQNRPKMFERLQKVSLGLILDTYGVLGCTSVQCPNQWFRSVDDLDERSSELCPKCKHQLYLRTVPDSEDALRKRLQGGEIVMADRVSTRLEPYSFAIVRDNDAATISLLLRVGVPKDGRDCYGRTMLHVAANNGSLAVVRALIAGGGPVDEQDDTLATPLHLAADEGHVEIANELLEAGANVHAKDKDEMTPLHWAAVSGREGTARALLDAGGNVDALDATHRTPIFWAVCGRSDPAVVRVFLDRGATLKRFDQDGANSVSPLHMACWTGSYEVVQMLLDHGMDPNIPNPAGRTPLHMVGSRCNIARLLVAKGADVNARDNRRNTPLHNAVSKNATNMVACLLELGGDPDARGQYGNRLLQNAAYFNFIEVAKILLQHGADVNAGTPDGTMPLAWAAKYGHIAMVRLLLEAEADVQVKDEFGTTPLLEAIEMGHSDIAELLIERGSDVNAPGKKGQTPLLTAVRKGNERIVASLRKHGALSDMADDRGDTPLSLARKKGMDAILILLESQQ